MNRSLLQKTSHEQKEAGAHFIDVSIAPTNLGRTLLDKSQISLHLTAIFSRVLLPAPQEFLNHPS